MPLRLSHLMTLTISLTWVARFTLPSMRCERSPNPVIVGVNTLCPPLLQKIGHAPPAPAAVPGAVHEHEGLRRVRLRRCWRAAQSGRACAGPALASTPRRVIATSLVAVIVSSLGVVCWLNLTWDASLRPDQRERNTPDILSLPTAPGHPPPVDNRDNRPPSRQRPARAYTGRSSESLGPLHALSVPVPRRAARAASGFGGRRPARAAQEGGA